MSSVSLSDYAAEHGLRKVGARPPLSRYIAETWRYRSFTATFAQYRVEAENERQRFGMLWAVIRPSLNALLYAIVFGLIFVGHNRPANFLAFIFVGTFVMAFLQGSLSEGARSIRSNIAMVTSLNFPRVCLPLAHVAQIFIQFLYTLIVMAAGLLLTGNWPRASWLVVLPVLVLMFLFGSGVSMLSAWIVTFFEDFAQVIPFISRLLFYTSGVFFSARQSFSAHPEFLAIWQYNPFFAFLELWRGLLLNGYETRPSDWTACILWAFGLFAVAFVLFWSAEEKYGRD